MSEDWIPGEISADGEEEFCWRDTSRNNLQTWQTRQKAKNWLMVGTVCSFYQQQLSSSRWDRRGPDWEEHSRGSKVITKRSINRNLLLCCEEYISWHLKSSWSKCRRCYRATRIKVRAKVSARDGFQITGWNPCGNSWSEQRKLLYI